MNLREIKVGMKVKVFGPCPLSAPWDDDEVGELAKDEIATGVVNEYAGDDLFRITFDGGDYDWLVDRKHMVPDTPEYLLATLVFGKKGEVIGMPGAPRMTKPNEERGGRTTSPEQSALMVLTLSPHTRAVLNIVDPQGLKQADAALLGSGWMEDSPWPEEKLSTREQAIETIGKMLDKVGHEMTLWQQVQNRPAEHPEYEMLKVMGDAAISEFARLNAEMRGLKRASLMDVGHALGLFDSEMFQAEEASAEEG